MKNLISWVKAGFFSLLPFLLAAHVTMPGGCLTIVFPPIPDEYRELLAHAGVLVPGLLGIYEAFARRVPTAHNYSLFNIIGRLLDELLPNRGKPVGPDDSILTEYKAGHGIAVYGLA